MSGFLKALRASNGSVMSLGWGWAWALVDAMPFFFVVVADTGWSMFDFVVKVSNKLSCFFNVL